MQHFTDATAAYTLINPRWKSSRRGVLEFVMRAHNSVNVRNRGRVYSFTDSMAELAVFLPEDMAAARRREYLAYIRSDWMRNMTMSGISMVPKLRELNIIEDSYWSKRSFRWSDLSVFSDINVSPLANPTSTLSSSGTFIPRLTASTTFTLRNIGKIGPRLALR
jgi:hypothetical protein